MKWLKLALGQRAMTVPRNEPLHCRINLRQMAFPFADGFFYVKGAHPVIFLHVSIACWP
jgi:hypothetical protein